MDRGKSTETSGTIFPPKSKHVDGARAASLARGQTYGRVDARVKTGGFVLSVMRPVLPPEDVPLHTHPEGSFTFILSGVHLSNAVDASDPCGPGTLIYNPPGTTHRDRFQELDGGRFLSISVPQGITDSLALPKRPTRLRQHQTLGLARAIARECLSWDRRSPLLTECLCLELLAGAGTAKRQNAGSAPAWLTRAQEILTEECTESITITGVARTVGVHPAHLARGFSRFFKRSPGEHLRRSRLARAADLLLETDLPLVEIALTCGFVDQSHFTNMFKRQRGLSPAAYRSRFKRNRS